MSEGATAYLYEIPQMRHLGGGSADGRAAGPEHEQLGRRPIQLLKQRVRTDPRITLQQRTEQGNGRHQTLPQCYFTASHFEHALFTGCLYVVVMREHDVIHKTGSTYTSQRRHGTADQATASKVVATFAGNLMKFGHPYKCVYYRPV